jgi:hypothetical protein
LPGHGKHTAFNSPYVSLLCQATEHDEPDGNEIVISRVAKLRVFQHILQHFKSSFVNYQNLCCGARVISTANEVLNMLVQLPEDIFMTILIQSMEVLVTEQHNKLSADDSLNGSFTNSSETPIDVQSLRDALSKLEDANQQRSKLQTNAGRKYYIHQTVHAAVIWTSMIMQLIILMKSISI